MTLREKTVCDVCGEDITDKTATLVARFHPPNSASRSIKVELCNDHARHVWKTISDLLRTGR